MILSQIAACSSNRVIGKDNKLIWHIPEDLQYFKEKTKNKIIIMGRKTFESLPKMLPHRFHIVISRNKKAPYDHPLLQFVASIEDAIRVAKEVSQNDPKWGEEVFCVGGAEIYKAMLPLTDKIYLTEIDREFDGDSFFPLIPNHFTKISSKESHQEDLHYHFVVYENRRKI